MVDVILMFGHRLATAGRWHLIDHLNIVMVDQESGALSAGYLLGDKFVAQFSVSCPRYGGKRFFPPADVRVEVFSSARGRGWYLISLPEGKEILGFSPTGRPPYRLSLPPVSGGWLKYRLPERDLREVNSVRFNRRSRRLFIDGNHTDMVTVNRVRQAFGLPEISSEALSWGPPGLAQKLFE